MILVISGAASPSIAQHHIQHQSPPGLRQGETETLIFSTQGLRPDQIEDIYLMYRMEGNLAYDRKHSAMENTTISVRLTPDPAAVTLEYFLRLELQDGSVITYPEYNPAGRPLSVNIRAQDPDPPAETEPQVQYNILSPVADSQVNPDDVLIAGALFYEDEAVMPDSIKLYLNGVDVSADAAISPHFISYLPDNLLSDEHDIRISYYAGGHETTLASWSFGIREPVITTAGSPDRRSLPSGRVELNARNQVFAGEGDGIYRGNFRVSGSEGDIHYSFSGLFTTQESGRLQPQNRFAGDLKIGNWFQVQAGHVYPQLNPLLMSGRRMYGLNSTIRTPNKKLNLNVVHGTLSRSIGLRYAPISQRTDTLAVSNGEPVTETSFVMGLRPGGSGTYRRRLTGGRLGLGNDEKFQVGINAMKIADDVNSLNVIRSFDDLPPELIGSELTAQERLMLSENPELFRTEGAGPRPQGNFMAGTDLLIKLDDNRIRLNADFAASLHNTDIGGGVLDQTSADDLGFDLDRNYENKLDRLSRLIVINEQMSTLPFRSRNGSIQPFVPGGIFAGQARMGLHYFNNDLTVRYRWIGPDYQSLANSSIRRDLAGYTINDRIRLLRNTLYVTLGHERLEDNVTGNRDATTVKSSYKANVSWYPVSRRLPRISAGIHHQTRSNGVERQLNPDLNAARSLAAVRNVHLIGGEPRVLPDPRSSRTLQYTATINRGFTIGEIVHDASFNISDMQTIDEASEFGDYDSRIYSVSLSSTFEIPLRTMIALSSNTSNSVNELNVMQVTGIQLGGSYYLMENKLNIYSDFSITRNSFERVALTVNENNTPSYIYDNYYEPDFGDTEINKNNSYNLRSGIQYDLNASNSIILNMNLNNVVDRLGLQQIPGDRVLQARYVYNF
ncbi:MAG: hypothetical protein WD266_02745 [Balneolales bacterium]